VIAVGGAPCAVVDAQVHAWDASPHNQAAPDGEVYALDLLRRHRELDGSPSRDAERVTERGLLRDVFDAGGVDRAVLQPVVLGDLFVLGFSPLEWHAEIASRLPGRFVLSGELDPGGGRSGSRGLAALARRHDLRGLTLCERARPAGRVDLGQPWLRGVLARCAAAGADVVHVGVGPSTRPAPWRHPSAAAAPWRHPSARASSRHSSAPSPAPAPHPPAPAGERRDPGQRWRDRPAHRPPHVPAWAEPVRAGSAQPVRAGAAARIAPPAFAARELRALAADLPEVRFVLGAASLPTAELVRLADLPNTHVVLTEILPWIGSLDFARAFGALLGAYGAERLLFGSGYPMLRPGPLVRELAAYRFPAELAGRSPRFDAAARRAVLGGTAARLYRLRPARVAAAGA
jgi:uncharacterized protein